MTTITQRLSEKAGNTRYTTHPGECWVCRQPTTTERLVETGNQTIRGENEQRWRLCCGDVCYSRIPQAERDFQAWYHDGYSTSGYLSAMGFD